MKLSRYICSSLLSCFFLASVCAEEDLTATNPALKQLVEGNKRYMEGKLLHPNRGFSRRFETLGRQKPFAIILGCADSRVSPEILFDQGIGDIFTVRVAGNVLGPLELDSIEFAALHFQSPILIVLGHENCGAVAAVVSGDTKDIESVAALIEPAVKKAEGLPGNTLRNAVKMNVESVVQQLKKSKVIAEAIAKDKILVVGGYYHLGDGRVEIINSKE